MIRRAAPPLLLCLALLPVPLVPLFPGGGAFAPTAAHAQELAEGHPPPGEPRPGEPAELSEEARAWVGSTLSGMSLREKAGQLVFPWTPGGYVSTREAAFDSLAAMVDAGIGGVNVSIGLPHEFAARVNALQRRADVPLLVGSDFESGGPGMRLGGVYALPSLISMGGGTEFPSTMAFGAIGDERMARAYGRVTGTEARAVGVHVNFAPVVDVNSNPGNPVINTRAFGESPEQVSRLAEAYLRGAREAGVLTTAKHFPGHGDTEVDSHLELPLVPADRARLDSVELPPFRRAVDAGVDAVMTAHVGVPAVTGSDSLPATLSPAVLQGLLREEMDFRGLVVTDAMTMGALMERYGPGTTSVRALQAGADVLLDPPDPVAAIDSVVAAVRDGRIPRERVEASARRVLVAKAKAGLHRGRVVPLDSVSGVVGRERHRALADTAAGRALTLVRDRRGAVPLDTARFDGALSVTLARERHLAAGRAFDARLRERLGGVAAARVTPETPASVYDSLRFRAESAPLVLLSVYLPPRAGAGSVSLPDRFRAFARDVLDGPAPAALLSFGSPYLLSDLPETDAFLTAWGGSEPSQERAADALTGSGELTGRLPVSLPPRHTRGDGLRRAAVPRLKPVAEPAEAGMDRAGLSRVDSLVRAAIRDSVTPGAALAVGRGGRLVRLRGYGRLDRGEGSPGVTDSTIYDLASLTKVAGTATALMSLVEEGRVSLEAPVSAYLPWFTGGGKSRVTVEQLLRHRGGLPPFREWWRDRRGRDAYRGALADLELAHAPGDTTVYSDLGFITLGYLVGEVTGRGLDRYLEEEVFAPLGMAETGFRPDSSLLPRIPPTEVDTVYRGRHVRGEVHDENAHAMGGVAGHAGLFSSARDLAVLAQLLLNRGWAAPRATGEAESGGGEPPDRPRAPVRWAGEAAGGAAPDAAGGPRLVRLVEGATVERFTAPGGDDSERGLGWRTATREPDGGSPFAPGAFGHTGFTGTSLWVDPARDLFVVLLTNRVNPTREESRHVELRRAVHRAAAEAAGPPDSSDSPAGRP